MSDLPLDLERIKKLATMLGNVADQNGYNLPELTAAAHLIREAGVSTLALRGVHVQAIPLIHPN